MGESPLSLPIAHYLHISLIGIVVLLLFVSRHCVLNASVVRKLSFVSHHDGGVLRVSGGYVIFVYHSLAQTFLITIPCAQVPNTLYP